MGNVCFTGHKGFDPELKVFESVLVPEAPLVTDRVYIALYDYTRNNKKELSFLKGEKLQVVDNTDGGWWRVKSMLSDAEGFVPSNYVEPYDHLKTYDWYFGKLDRKSAEVALLRNGLPGSFIIRKSEGRPGDFTLSLHDTSFLKHYHIKQSASGGCYIHKKEFADLPSLVDHYKRFADNISRKLLEACPRVDPWEIPKERLVCGKQELGKGHYGVVLEGKWNNNIHVAVKVLKERQQNDDYERFLHESNTMKSLVHSNIVRCYGVCSVGQPVYIVLELMSNGALHKYLKSSAGESLTTRDLVKMAAQVASGMVYLEKKRLVHRDIAARNILVGGGLEVKIGDFGLAQVLPLDGDTFIEKTNDQLFAVKWASPEVLTAMRFSMKSDLWSLGVTMYEIFTKGYVPFPGYNNFKAKEFVLSGKRMQKPFMVDEKVFKVVEMCWLDYEERPSVEVIKWRLDELIHQLT